MTKKNWAFSQLRICRTPSPLSFARVSMKDAQCAESNEKSIFPIFRFWGIWSFTTLRIVWKMAIKWPKYSLLHNINKNLAEKKLSKILWTFFFFLKSSETYWKIFSWKAKKIMLEGLRPQAQVAFGLNPPSQLVLRYHWLVF